MDMAREDLGLVWMGDMLLQGEPLLMDQGDAPFFTESPHTLEDLRNRASLQQYTPEMDSFMMLDDFDDTYCEENVGSNKFMTSAATQTMQPGSRKIKPVKHPGLKLQTPIAYQRDTDLSVIPIQRDGMAVCEKCGAIGVKHAFYTRERRFCSMQCARGPTEIENMWGEQQQQQQDSQQNFGKVQTLWHTPMFGLPHQQQLNTNVKGELEHQDNTTSPQMPSSSPLPDDPPFPPDKRSMPDLAHTYDWTLQLSDKGFTAASVSCFKHAPMSDCWDNITVGMKVEVENTDCDNFSEDFPDSFWVATVLQIAGELVEIVYRKLFCVFNLRSDCKKGKVIVLNCVISTGGILQYVHRPIYTKDFQDVKKMYRNFIIPIGYKALLRYEGFGQNSTKDFWVNLCSSMVHPVGWCATRGKPLIPPKTIEDKYKDWKEFLVKRLTGARTLPSNFYSKVHDSLKSRFRCDLNLEVVDKNRLSQVKVATIKKIVGKRLHVRYYDSGWDGSGFWCHEDSPLIHPVGWARRVGHALDASPAYVDRCFKGLRDKDDATEDLFPIPEPLPTFPSGICFQEGMKLEAVDPLNLSSVCVATVKKVLNDGFLMIRVDSYDIDEGNVGDWFCYHMTSPYILPPGFCSQNSIPVIPPKGYDVATFDWADYLVDAGAIAAPCSLFNRDIPSHGFAVGMRLEATDLMDPRLVCVGTVSRIVGRLLKIHFDGWEDEYDQWLDCESSDIYPVGWCQLVAHKLEGPRTPVKNGVNAAVAVKGGLKTGVRKRGRRRIVNKKLVSPGVPTNKSSPLLDSPLAMPVSAPVTPLALETECLKREPAEANVLTGDMKQSYLLEMNGHGITNHEPEMSVEPAGPYVQPRNSSTDCNITSFINNDSSSSRVIPRLVDSNGSCESRDLVPDKWNVSEVAQFLRVNDCAAYCDSFSQKKIDGKTLLTLTKDQIIDLTGMKVGPSLKIYDLIQQLKIKVSKTQDRMKASLKKLL